MLLPLQVQVRRRETAKQTEMRVQSHAFLRQREHEEAWIPLQPSMPGDADTEFVKAYVTTTHGESCGQAVTAREYLDVMCPVSGSKRVAPEDENANTLGDGTGLSKSQLASLPLDRRIRALFAKGQKSCMKFSRIRQFVTEPIEPEQLIAVIQDSAHLVQGNWVAKSTLRCGGNVTWENMRDSALFQFARSRNVKPELVSNCLKRNSTKSDPTLAKMRREVLAEFSRPRGYGSAADALGSIDLGSKLGKFDSGAIQREYVPAGTIAAKFPDDFDYNLNVTVKSFNIKVGSRAAIPINSNRIKDSRVIRSYLENANKGDIIFVYNIDAQVRTENQVIDNIKVTDFALTIK